jgi:hypothetical protein
MLKVYSLLCLAFLTFSFINAFDDEENEYFVQGTLTFLRVFFHYLHCSITAAYNGQMNQVGLLLYQGAFIDFADQTGLTALMAG